MEDHYELARHRRNFNNNLAMRHLVYWRVDSLRAFWKRRRVLIMINDWTDTIENNLWKREVNDNFRSRFSADLFYSMATPYPIVEIDVNPSTK